METCNQELLKIKAEAVNRLSEFLKLVLSEASMIIKGSDEFYFSGLINKLMNSAPEGKMLKQVISKLNAHKPDANADHLKIATK